MVWFVSSTMDIKKSTFSDQFPPGRKVVSGFSLGILASLIILSVVLFNISFKAPFFNPMFQGFNSFGSNSSILISWPFSFSNTPVNVSSSATVTAPKLQNAVGMMETGETHEANASEIGKNGKSMNYSGKGVDLEGTHLGNFSEKVKNGNFTVKSVATVTAPELPDSVDMKETGEAHEANSSEIGRNGKSMNYTGKGVDLEGTHLGNFSEKVKNGNFTVKSVDSIENSNFGKIGIITNDNAGNLTYNGGISSEKNNVAISQNDSLVLKVANGSYGECDIFDGRWVRDDTKPYYHSGSCPYIDRDFDCHFNRRPDDGFVKWKWQPYGCDIPSLNATDFLERLRGKKLVFVGDSLNRNMWESLVCILRNTVRNKKRVYEISGRREFKKKGFYAFRFEDYDCSVDFVSSPFIVRESSFNGRNGSFETLRLDLMDRTTSMYHDADVVVFNTGHWWTHEKTSRGEDYYQEGKHVYPRLKVLEAYKRALGTWARWIDKNIDSSRTQVIFRGYSVTHFRGGPWNSGGQCHKETEPIFNTAHLAKYPSKMRALEYVLREMRTPVIYLNISRLTDYRKDGHPSIYRMKYKTAEEQIAAVHSQDCSHWCLPGVPDTWNELLYASLLKVGKGSWRS